MAFYNQTMSAVTSGRAKMAAAGLPVRRPNDYFCENLKTDAHMTKVCTAPFAYICVICTSNPRSFYSVDQGQVVD